MTDEWDILPAITPPNYPLRFGEEIGIDRPLTEMEIDAENKRC
jgi:hypothetical protein